MLSRGEAKIFNIDATKSGWAKNDVILTIEQISKAISYIQKRDNIHPKVKTRLLSFSIKTLDKSEKKLYLFKNELGLHKIGISIDPAKRARSLLNASGYKIFVVGVWEVFDAFSQEQHLHKVFKRHRAEGEWFNVDLSIKDIEDNLTCEFNRVDVLGK